MRPLFYFCCALLISFLSIAPVFAYAADAESVADETSSGDILSSPEVSESASDTVDLALLQDIKFILSDILLFLHQVFDFLLLVWHRVRIVAVCVAGVWFGNVAFRRLY